MIKRQIINRNKILFCYSFSIELLITSTIQARVAVT